MCTPHYSLFWVFSGPIVEGQLKDEELLGLELLRCLHYHVSTVDYFYLKNILKSYTLLMKMV